MRRIQERGREWGSIPFCPNSVPSQDNSQRYKTEHISKSKENKLKVYLPVAKWLLCKSTTLNSLYLIVIAYFERTIKVRNRRTNFEKFLFFYNAQSKVRLKG